MGVLRERFGRAFGNRRFSEGKVRKTVGFLKYLYIKII
jgi:hypothetical protein